MDQRRCLEGPDKRDPKEADVAIALDQLISSIPAWGRQSRFSMRSKTEQLQLLALAGMVLGVRLTMAVTITLKPHHTPTDFMRELRAAIRERGGGDIRYVGLFSSFRLDKDGTVHDHRHVHYVIEFPTALERQVAEDFVIRYAGITEGVMQNGQWATARFWLYKRAHHDDPMQHAMFVAINNTRRGYDGLFSYVQNYLHHHVKDLRKLAPGHGVVEITASAEIKRMAIQIGALRPEEVGLELGIEAIVTPACCLPRRCLEFAVKITVTPVALTNQLPDSAQRQFIEPQSVEPESIASPYGDW